MYYMYYSNIVIMMGTEINFVVVVVVVVVVNSTMFNAIMDVLMVSVRRRLTS